jgi:hypothetical protein
MEITTALRSHDCRYNKRHRIAKGDRRLTIKSDGDAHHYCLACTRLFIADSLARLNALSAEVDGLTANA